MKQGLIREGEHFFHLSPSSSSSPFRLLIHPPTANDIYIYIPSFERAFLTVKIKNGRDIIEAFVTVLSSDKFFPIGPIDRIRHPKVTNYTVNFPYISVQAVHSKREGDAFGDPFRRWRWFETAHLTRGRRGRGGCARSRRYCCEKCSAARDVSRTRDNVSRAMYLFLAPAAKQYLVPTSIKASRFPFSPFPSLLFCSFFRCDRNPSLHS